MHTTKNKIKKAIDILAERITSNTRAEEAVRFSKAALSFAETLKIIQQDTANKLCSEFTCSDGIRTKV